MNLPLFCGKAQQEVTLINSFLSWIGGKKSSRNIIIPRFPLFYERYVEVFGGGGWILFAKPIGNDFEVFNDANSNISNLFYCVREHSAELIDRLRYVLNSREDFERIKHIVNEKAEIGDVKRAADFYQLIRYSYASSCDSYGGKPHSMWSNFPLIEQASRRLQKVIIENKDFEKLILSQDSEMSFFYCDPPYYSTEGYYSNVGFTKADHERLRDTLKNISGKFLLSYNDCAEIRELYKGYEMYSYERLNNIRQRFDGGSMFGELLIANYDINERLKQNRQISFFEEDFIYGDI
ncbi:MAG: DNA adenine methylase [Eubacterium sp.]|nr:DNA adenine methylase [Eubacterium sp.]